MFGRHTAYVVAIAVLYHVRFIVVKKPRAWLHNLTSNTNPQRVQASFLLRVPAGMRAQVCVSLMLCGADRVPVSL